MSLLSTCPQLFDQLMPSHSGSCTALIIPIPAVTAVIDLAEITILAVFQW